MKMNEISKVALVIVCFLLLMGLAGTCDRMDMEYYKNQDVDACNSNDFAAIESAYDSYFYSVNQPQ